MGASIIANQMKMLSGRCRYAERLLHQTIGLVAISIWSFFATFPLVFIAPLALGSLASSCCCRMSATSLAFHLAVCQKAARYPARTP